MNVSGITDLRRLSDEQRNVLIVQLDGAKRVVTGQMKHVQSEIREASAVQDRLASRMEELLLRMSDIQHSLAHLGVTS